MNRSPVFIRGFARHVANPAYVTAVALTGKTKARLARK
jgi:hypothetical protein